MQAVTNAASMGEAAAKNMDLDMLVGGSESGIVPTGSLIGVGAVLGLDEAWRNDPRALWSSFVMIIVSHLSFFIRCRARLGHDVGCMWQDC